MELSRPEILLLIACCEWWQADKHRPLTQADDMLEHLMSRLYESAGGRME
jgi:hypothetical protein|tara:strand:- start:270 stop:419 length:150 start_codon:yes stop_codon:yes gene_type:complete